MTRENKETVRCAIYCRKSVEDGLEQEFNSLVAHANMIESGKFSTVNELANYLKFDRSHVARTLSLVNLAPDIVMAIMSGKAPESVTLNKILYGLPDNWQEQHEFLGMS